MLNETLIRFAALLCLSSLWACTTPTAEGQCDEEADCEAEPVCDSDGVCTECIDSGDCGDGEVCTALGTCEPCSADDSGPATCPPPISHCSDSDSCSAVFTEQSIPTIELAVVADFRYVEAAGGESQAIARIESAMTGAGDLVLRDLGIRVSVIDLIVHREEGSLALNESDVGGINDVLNAAVEARRASTGSQGLADGFFVWTKSAQPAGLALSFLDQECSERAVAVAEFSQPETEVFFAARSIGRLVGAPDDADTDCLDDLDFIMGDAPNFASPSFSPCSAAEVLARRGANRCLQTAGDGVVAAICGDGQIAIGEDCDLGVDNGLGLCAADCTWATIVDLVVALDHRYIASAGGEQTALTRAQSVLEGVANLAIRDLHLRLNVTDILSFPTIGGPEFNNAGFDEVFPYLQAVTDSRAADPGALAGGDLLLALTDLGTVPSLLAFQDGACSAVATGVTQIQSTITEEIMFVARTLARGIGAKSDNATTCDADAGFIMGDAPVATSPEFSSCSTDDVEAFVEQAACIETGL